jgi:hypothetical protein
MMVSQKLTNCWVAAIALVTAAYLSTPHSSTIARLAFGALCLAIRSFCFLAKASKMVNPGIARKIAKLTGKSIHVGRKT